MTGRPFSSAGAGEEAADLRGSTLSLAACLLEEVQFTMSVAASASMHVLAFCSLSPPRGKSTLLGLLAGFDSPTSGSIRLEGEEITQMDEDELALLRGRKLGFVFQSYNLIPTLTAEENVMLPIELRGDSAGAQARARELLDAVGLRERSSHYPAQLS